MRLAILRCRSLFLVGILCMLTACGGKSPPPAQPEVSSQQSAVVEPTQEPAPPPEPEKEPDVTVTAKGYGAVVDDPQQARDEALMDAYNKAVEAGLGVKVTGKTVVKNFQLIEQIVVAERKGYVKSYKILNEDPKSELGYEISIEAVVSKDPVSKIDDLKRMIGFMGNPRLMVYIEAEDKNRSIIEGYVTRTLMNAGYSLIDSQQMERIKERDFQERKLLGDWEAAAILGNRLGADVAIVGSVSAEVTTKTTNVRFPLIIATANVYFKVIATETAEILHSVTNEDFPDVGDLQGQGGGEGGDAKAINEAIAKGATKATEKLMWELPTKIGMLTMRLRVRDCTYEQANQIANLIKPLRNVEDARLLSYQNSIAEIDVEASGKTETLVSNLQKLQDVKLEIERFALGTIEVRLSKT
jgi:ribosomal protein S9